MIDPYDDADLYDLEYENHTEDIAFYVDRARQAASLARPGSPSVLELGCGTGRLTLPVARAGATVTGVDRSSAMIEALRRKLALEPDDVRSRVALVEDSYPSDVVQGAFHVVLWPFNALHHCPDEDALCRTLSWARDRLLPGAKLYLDAYLPDPELYGRDPERRYEPCTFVDPRTRESIESWEQGFWEEEARTHHVLYTYRWASGRERKVHLKLRMFSLDELRGALRRTNLTLLRESEDFRGTTLNARSLKWVAAAVRSQ